MIAIMIASLAMAGPSIIEMPEANAGYITLQTIVKVGKLNGKEQALAQVVDDILLNGSENFNQDQLKEYSTLAGEAMRCTLSADHFRIQLEVPKGRMELGAEMIADVLRRPRFDQEAIDADILSAKSRSASLWTELVLPFQLDYSSVTRQNLLDFFRKTFVPESTTITIGGAFVKGDGDAALEKELNDWQAPKPVPTYGRIPPPEPAPSLLAKHSFPLSTIELYGPEYSAADSSFPAQLLVATALGVGKGSSMHQVLREKLHLSYEQLAMIEPTPDGLSTHLVMMQAPSGQEQNALDTMRSSLLADVKNWSEATRQRALGMARAFLTNEAVANPLFFDAASVIGNNLEERTFLQGYWEMKARENWDANKLLDLMSQVSVDQMKSIAANFLTDAQGAIILGKS